jgi:hypothetical protein
MTTLRRKQTGRRELAVLGLSALALATACTKKGEGLVLVQLSSSQPIDHVTVLVTAPANQSKLGMATASWPSTLALQIGVYVPQSYSGSVDVIACGFDGAGALVAATPKDPASFISNVQPGESSSIVMVSIAAGGAAPLCGMFSGAGGQGGGAGTGGTSSTGGTNGTGGAAGAPGAGGTNGTGGASGAPGTGGTNGTGGAAGAPGAGGTNGTGGVAGAPGTGTWGGAKSLAADASGDTFPAVAVDANGNAVVVYEDGGQMWATRYDAASSTWGTPGAVDPRGAGNVSKPSVGVDKNGNYLAVWGLDSSGALRGIWQSTSTDGIHWSTPTSITVTAAFGPVLSMNANGQAIVAWTEEIANNNYQASASIRSAPGSAGASWSTPQVLRPGDDDSDRDPAVAMDGSGNAFVGWVQSDGSGSASASANYGSVWMRQYTAGAGWNAAGLFESYDDQSASDVSISANTGGDAIVTYIQITDTNPAAVQIWSRRYSAVSTSFAANPLIVAQDGSVDTIVAPSVALDNAGNATVAFAIETMTGKYEVYTSQLASTAPTWPSSPTAMENDDIAQDDDPDTGLGFVTMPVVRSDPNGNVTLVWRKRTAASGTRFDLVARRCTAGAWGAQVSLENNTTDSVLWPTLAVGANGTAATAWFFDNAFGVWANVFHE